MSVKKHIHFKDIAHITTLHKYLREIHTVKRHNMISIKINIKIKIE